MGAVASNRRAPTTIAPSQLSYAITPSIEAGYFPEKIRLLDIPIRGDLTVRYTIDDSLQKKVKKLLRKYNPDYGMVVAIDPDSGKILSMVSSTRSDSQPSNLTLLNSYPAASISKIITVVAALNENEVTADTIIPFNGKTTTLYKKNVLSHQNHKWTRKYSLSKSFGLSVNSVFGRVGVNIGGERMLDYAQRLGFNGRFASDFFFKNGMIEIDADDSWQVAEMASGFTRRNTLSPLHAAVLAATAINGGQLIAPTLVREVEGENGEPLYWTDQPASTDVMSEQTALELKKMMISTVAIGSARASFARFNRGVLKDVVVGGKTGSLTGASPQGKYDWFVGFGELGTQKIAYAVLCINKERWYVKSARLAREMLEFYFRETLSTSNNVNS